MMRRNDGDLEARLRRSLSPGPEAVDRAVRGALSGRAPAARPRLLPAAALTAAVLAAVLALLVLPERPREPAASIETVGGVVVVRPQGGRPAILGSGGSAPRSPSPGTLIMIHGGGR